MRAEKVARKVPLDEDADVILEAVQTVATEHGFGPSRGAGRAGCCAPRPSRPSEVCKLGEGVSRVGHGVKCDLNCDCVVVQRHDVGGIIHLAA
jgi:hypothetical protein